MRYVVGIVFAAAAQGTSALIAGFTPRVAAATMVAWILATFSMGAQARMDP